MTFADQLSAASGSLTARQIGHVTDYSPRTVENWRCSRKTPLPRHQKTILRAVKRAAKKNTRNLPADENRHD